MLQCSQGTVTRLLAGLQAGDPLAEEHLVRAIYDELHSLAESKLRSRPRGSTLCATVLIHEAFLRVLRNNAVPPQNRRHLFFAFARAMWQIIVECERRKRIPSTGVSVDVLSAVLVPEAVEDVARLDMAMQNLLQEHPFEYEVMLLRKILGFSIPDTAELLETSEATVKRGWAFAKAELSRTIHSEAGCEH